MDFKQGFKRKQEKEKREIINNDEKDINILKENIRKELKQETEKKETA